MTGEWNRGPDSTAASANLDAAPYGFKVTGDAAWDSCSDDYAMFTADGNTAVGAMVRTAREMTRAHPETEVLAWIRQEKEHLDEDRGEHEWLPRHRDLTPGRAVRKIGHEEIHDTMVRETIAYALDEAWQAAYGHRFDEWAGRQVQPTEVNLPGDEK